MNLSRAIRNREALAGTAALKGKSCIARKHKERAEQLRVAKIIRREMRR